MAGIYDTEVNNGDKVMENGRWKRSPTVFGRAVRSLLAWRGRWPAGRGRVIGNGLWEELPSMKRSEADEQRALEYCEESQQEWVDDGRLVVQSARVDHTLDGSPVILLEEYDTGTRLQRKVPVPVDWKK